jgi:hypothetical protein
MHGLRQTNHRHRNLAFEIAKIVLLGDVDQAKAYFIPFGDIVNLSLDPRRLGVQSWRKTGAWFVTTLPWAWKLLWAHPLVLLGNICQVESCFSPFGDSVSLGTR